MRAFLGWREFFGRSQESKSLGKLPQKCPMGSVLLPVLCSSEKALCAAGKRHSTQYQQEGAMHIGRKLSGLFALGVFATVGGMVATDPAFAKIDVDKLTIGGEARIRYEYRIGANFGSNSGDGGGTFPAGQDGGQSNESAASSRVRVSVGYDLTPDVSFFAQLQDARVWGSESCAFAPAAADGGCTSSGIGAVSSANNAGTGVDLHQGYIQVKNILTPGLSAKIGRQEIIFGDHRLFGNFGWSQIGNSFDAVRLTHTVPLVDIDLFWARISDNDGGAAQSTSGVIFPGAGKGTYDQDIYGAYVTFKPIPNWTIEPYFILLQDGRDQSVVVPSGAAAGSFCATTSVCSPQTRAQTRHTAGGRINGKAGIIDATLEGAFQFGSLASGATNNARDLHVNAHAEAAKLGFTFPIPMTPRLGFEVNYASGDGDTNKCTAIAANNVQSCTGGNFNTFDNLYPTNHFHYGYMDLMAWKNMVNYRATFDVKPTPASKIQVDYIIHRLARTNDNWYRAGQVVYATTCGGSAVAGCNGQTNQAASLGQEINLHYWRTFKGVFKFEVGYGHFFTGEYIEKAKTGQGGSGPRSTSTFSQDSDQNWGYVMGSVLF
jgi:hypothetical protein